jgi:RNA recognition motif-containing protein
LFLHSFLFRILVVDIVVNAFIELDGRLLDVKRALARGMRSTSKDTNHKLFLGGLPYEATEEGVKEYFNRFGRVVSVQIVMDRGSGRPRGFGFVSFEDNESVDNALAERTHVLHGKIVEVKRAEPKAEHTESRGTTYPLQGSSNGFIGMYPSQVKYMQTMQMMQMRQLAIMNVWKAQSYVGSGTQGSYGGSDSHPRSIYRNTYGYGYEYSQKGGGGDSPKRGRFDSTGDEKDCDSFSYSKRGKL